ncbi:MAG: HmuY family protein [Candidatus Pseudobacter hemicellulosilyticus]|uniref:HmuY family protein n=1 Tax=Candidatus Pseudobacter hemicellulosilyticus TaxID=3121375 RepID=A0AAJ5WNF9_9BACT|nr:MAG: HmuY family protein [Pseudobacter sp.]
MKTTNHTGTCRSYGACMVLLVLALCYSCTKDTATRDVNEPPPGDTAVNTGLFYKLQRVENFAGDTAYDGAPDGIRSAMYFSLERKESVPKLYQKSSHWDLVFHSIFNSSIGCNNGKDATPSSHGAGGNGIGGITILAKDFDQVTDIPTDAEIKGNGGVGLDEAGNYGYGLGWCLYDFGGTIKGDGSYNKSHVCYALPERTIIVRTAKGHYAKIRMISIYKNAFSPEQWLRNVPAPYFTFEYLMVPKGSTRFELKP